MTDHPSMTLARNVAAMRFADFPAATIHKTKIHILDTLGAAIAGGISLETQTVLRAFGLADQSGVCGSAPVWGTALALDSRTASFINGVSAHAFELDDCGGCDHSGAVVLPAVVAALGDIREAVTGQHFLTAVIAGYEVGRRVLEACGGYESFNGLGWHSTGVCGAFGAASAVGALHGFDAKRHASALGVACSYAGGTWAFIHDGSQTKKLHAGRAAEGGLSAARLAAAGLDGPLSVFDASGWGNFFATFARGEADENLLSADFGQFWRINRCSIKPYATCRGTHSAVDAVEKMLAGHGFAPSDIARIDVGMSAFQAGMCGGKTIASRADAQMDFDFAKVVEASKDNPVFYVQYAHARTASLHRRAAEAGIDASAPDLSRLDTEELALVKFAAQFPRVVETAAAAREPHRIAFYLYDLAAAFHSLWNVGNDRPDRRFLVPEDSASSAARLLLADGCAQIIRNGLSIMGVEAVAEM